MTDRPKSPAPGRLERLDGRLKLLLLITACFVCQYLPATLLPLWLALLATLFAIPAMRGQNLRAMLHGGVAFILFWLVMTAGSGILQGKDWLAALAAAMPLCGRLLALTLVGTAFVGLASPLETGRAAAWFLRLLLRPLTQSHRRPSAGGRIWKVALAIALTAWFLPLTLRMANDVRAGMRARGLVLPWWKKAFLVVGASLRILERTAEELAVGLGSRRLDDWRSWQ